MSFADPLHIYLPLPESNNILSRSLSTSTTRTRPKSYHPTPLTTTPPSRRGSVSSTHHPRASIDLPALSISRPEIHSSEYIDVGSLPTPIRSPPPAYVHIPTQESTPLPRSRQHDRPPPAYFNSPQSTTNTRPRRSSSCSARFSTDGVPARRLTYRRISSLPTTSLSTASNRHSIAISPIEQSPSTQEQYGTIPIHLHASSSLPSTDAETAETDSVGTANTNTSFETARSSPPPSPPSRKAPRPPYLINTPPGRKSSPNAAPLRPSVSGSRFTESAEDLEGEAVKEWQAENDESKSDGTWCCGIFWVESTRSKGEERRREIEIERELRRRGAGGGYYGGLVF